jgi:hypothetical protein
MDAFEKAMIDISRARDTQGRAIVLMPFGRHAPGPMEFVNRIHELTAGMPGDDTGMNASRHHQNLARNLELLVKGYIACNAYLGNY